MMAITVKEKVIRQSIARIEKRLTAIEAILDFDAVGEFFAVHKEADELKKAGLLNLDALDKLLKRKKNAEKIIKQQTDIKLWDKRLTLKQELLDLRRELFYVGGIK
jgi:hypothetical protein